MSKHQEALLELEDILIPLNTELLELLHNRLDNLGEDKRRRMIELFDIVAERSSDDTVMQFVYDYPEMIVTLFEDDFDE